MDQNSANNDNESGFSYSPEDEDARPVQQDDSISAQSASWTASEYIAHAKSLNWYVVLGLVVAFGVLFAAIIFKDIPSAIAIGVMGIVFGVYAARPPQELQYSVDSRGVVVGTQTYAYDRLKSFSVIQEGPVRSVLITPLQRFALPINMYYSPEDEDQIIAALSSYMPYEEKKHDMVDRLMRKIRF